jgi:hypothetical protein
LRWSKVRQLVTDLDGELTRVENRINTAKDRKYQLSWKPHREQYLRRVKKVRSLHRQLKRLLVKNEPLIRPLGDMQDELGTLYDVKSKTVEKHAKIQDIKEKWDKFQAALDDTIRSDYDIFQERDIEPDPTLCFVLMPFDKKYDSLYTQTIKSAVKRVHLKCRRADDIFSSVAIVQDVWAEVNRARIVIADMTDRNQNVFYEIGLAHSLRQPVILLSQKEGDVPFLPKKDEVPFDVRHIRCIFYKDTKTGRRVLATKLMKTLRNLLK